MCWRRRNGWPRWSGIRPRHVNCCCSRAQRTARDSRPYQTVDLIGRDQRPAGPLGIDHGYSLKCSILTAQVSTLRKAMEPPGSEGGSFGGNRERGERSDRGERGERGDRDGGRRNRSRNRGGRRPQGEPGSNNNPADGSNRSEGASSAPAGNDPVKNLIDLVE
jgi:hypothetical protein